MDLVSVTTSPCTSSTTNQNGHPPAPRRLFSFLSVAWGFVSDVDIESERYRGLGSARFTLGTLVRLASLRSYKGRLSYLPPAMVNSSPDATPQPPRRPLSRSITEGLEGFCRTPIHRTCSDMGLSEQRSLRKGDGERERERERERQERERERERRRERARGVGVVRASSLAEDREREVEAEEKMEETSGTSSESTEREECDNIASTNGNGEEEENKPDGDEVDGEGVTKARDLSARDEGNECNENYQTTPPEMQRTLRKNSAPSSQIINAFFSQPIGADTDQDLEVAAYGKEDEDINGTYFQREAFPLDKSRERALTISSSPFRQSPFKAFKPKTLDQNQNPSRPRPLSLLHQSHSNSLPPKFPSLSLSLSPTPPSSPSCASPHSSYLAPRPNTPSSSSPSPSFHSPSPSFNFDLAEPAGPLKNRPHMTSSINLPEDNLLPPLDQPLPTRDWVTIEGDFVLVLAIYQTHLGADLLAAPQARFDDGLIHLTFVRAGISRATLLRLFLAMERGAHLSLSSPYVSHVSARAFRLQPLSPRGTLTVDGELVPYGPLQAQQHNYHVQGPERKEKRKRCDVWPCMVTRTRNLCSAFNTSNSEQTLAHTQTVNTHPEQCAANAVAPEEQLVVCHGIEGGRERRTFTSSPPTIPAGPKTQTHELLGYKSDSLTQGFSTLACEIHFPAEFSSNPNQTHLNILIKVSRIESYQQVSLIKVGAKLCRKLDFRGPELRTPALTISPRLPP
ncbi:hypothetical protein M9458_032076 [Cirrhinus mrigala]|uniref:YegS/DAGK C-terminal domain-containing protein n=1 Tax=Cirrhinus mrigala TaxID=683832 RepID=A0ABD0PCM3_CIRMR